MENDKIHGVNHMTVRGNISSRLSSSSDVIASELLENEEMMPRYYMYNMFSMFKSSTTHYNVICPKRFNINTFDAIVTKCNWKPLRYNLNINPFMTGDCYENFDTISSS